MRLIAVAFAILALAACDGVATSDGNAPNPAGGYIMEVRADEGVATYLITTPDGRVVAGRAAEGASALLDAADARALGVAEPVNREAPPERLALRVPGLDISIAADEAEPDSGSARVSINAAGRQVLVDADEGGPGDGDDRANVRITGASEADVRDFIVKADRLSPQVQAQMLTELGLE